MTPIRRLAFPGMKHSGIQELLYSSSNDLSREKGKPDG